MNLVEGIIEKAREDYIVDNVIADGVLARTVLIPKGDIVVGEIHKFESINILVRGEIKIYFNGVVKHIKAPFMLKSNANTRKVVYALEEAVWTSIHKVKSADIKEIEKMIIIPSTKEDVIKELKQINTKEFLCLG